MRESIAELSVRWRYAVAAVASAISATTKGLRNSIQVLGCLSLVVLLQPLFLY